MTTSLADAAVLLARRGYRVFPVGADKAPRTPRGHHDGTSDEAVVRGWSWGDGIGLVIPDRTLVVDVDPRNGGDTTIKCLDALPSTRTVATQSGGLHFYYALPDDRDVRGSLGPGIDIKKPGRGYVLVPPTPGYRYLRGGRPAPAPQWLLDELTVDRKPESASGSTPKFFHFQAGTPYGLAALSSELGDLRATATGSRRSRLNKAAFVLATLVAGGELHEERTLQALLDSALDTGLDETQALSRMKSGWDAGLRKPRSAA